MEALGSVGRVDHVDDMMERLYMAEEERFSKPPQPALLAPQDAAA